MKIKQFTKDEAIEFTKGGKWKEMSDDVLFHFQLYQKRLCCDFSAFHKAAETALSRSVWTHEFTFTDKIKAKYEGKQSKPDLDEIINHIPTEKLIIVTK